MVSCFIGIVPPPGISEAISHFAGAFGCRPGWPPHITVKAQPGLTCDLGWLESVQEACRTHAVIAAKLGGPIMLGESVLCLHVQSPTIEAVHRTILNTINPSPEERARFFEGDLYFPHLTLAMRGEAIDGAKLRAMQQQAAGLGPFPCFAASELVVFCIDSQGTYQRVAGIQLGAEGTRPLSDD